MRTQPPNRFVTELLPTIPSLVFSYMVTIINDRGTYKMGRLEPFLPTYLQKLRAFLEMMHKRGQDAARKFPARREPYPSQPCEYFTPSFTNLKYSP
jgi:hypothetical protein